MTYVRANITSAKDATDEFFKGIGINFVGAFMTLLLEQVQKIYDYQKDLYTNQITTPNFASTANV